jgi:metal-responsive CopG/Arc/MetJ family transcriptional regulator
MPLALVKRLDEICKSGLYRNRTEAISDAVRHLLDRYLPESEISKLLELHRSGKLKRDKRLEDLYVVSNLKKVRETLRESLGTDSIDVALRKIRGI